MLFGTDERKYYRFPSQSSIFDYEMNHTLYFPDKDMISSKDTFSHSSNKANYYSLKQNTNQFM